MSIRVAGRRVGWWAAVVCCSWLALPCFAQDPAPAQPIPDPAATETTPPPENPATEEPSRRRLGDIVNFGSSAYLGKDESVDTLIAIGGTVTSEGEVRDTALAVFGNTHVSGPVRRDAVAVAGDVYVDGTVGGEVVAVLGNVTLGPNAVVENDVTSVGGTVTADPAAVIHGTIEQVAAQPVTDVASKFIPWFKHGLLLGRPLAFEPGFGWAWTLALFFVAVYLLIAFVFPTRLREAEQTFANGFGESVLAGLLTVLLLPLIGLALLVTIIGIPLLPFLWIALFAGTLFGKAAVMAAMGQRLIGFINAGPLSHIAVATFIGCLIVLGAYVVPMFGFIAMMVLNLLGLGAFVYWMLRKQRARQLQRRSEQAARRVDLAKSQESSNAASGTEIPPVPTGEPLPADHSAAALLALPRAGFWIRMAALFVDVVLVTVVINVAGDGDIVPWAIAVYGAVMWKIKGTTIGGTLCNLQVVRLDGRELDWPTAIVRAVSCYLSVLMAGLGFFWIAFDEERQSWHDKIAGTVVVRTARTVALV